MNKSSKEFLDSAHIEELEDESPDLEGPDSFTPSVLGSTNASPNKYAKFKMQKIKTRKRSE